MLTKSEYSTSTSSLSTVFSGSLAELGSIMQAQSVSKLPGDQSQKSGTFRQRLKDRINKNKDHLFKVQQVIEESKREILELQDLKKLLFHGEVAPLSTFVDQVSNTTNSALLSLQRELALKECDYEYVVYDRNVICLDHKFKSEENSYLKHHSQAAKFFKHTKYDTEEQKYKQGCRDTERLLQNLDGLNQSCKHQIKQKNQKLREIKLRIRQKNQALLTKQEEYSRLTRLAGQDSSSPKITLSQVKEELRILRNEKMTLQECEYDCRTEVKKLAKSLKTLKNRDQVEASQVKALEEAVGKVTENCLNEIKKHSVVENSVVRLKTYLKKEKETKDKFLLEVNHKKKVGNDRYHATESKTMKAIDWNKIDNEDPTSLSTTQKIWEERKSKEQTKLKNQSDDTESQVEVSLISFDPD